MWSAVYRVETGALVSTGTVIADPLPNGLASKELGPAAPVGTWNSATLEFEVIVELPATWTQYQFLKRMTASERIAIRERAKTDVHVYDFMDLLNRSGEVVRANPDVIAGLNYLESLGDIGAGRAQEILNG